MCGEQGVELLPVREEGGSPHLAQTRVGLSSVWIREKRAEDVGGMVLATVTRGNIGPGVARVNVGVALDSVTNGRIKLGYGGQLDPLRLNGAGRSHLHGPDDLGQIVVR